MKPSDEQVQEWAQEWETEYSRLWAEPVAIPAMRDSLLTWEWFGRKNAYIAHKAYAAGRESMREEAARVCDEAAEFNQLEYSESPNAYAEGASDIADELAQLIRDLPISEGDNDH